MYAVDFGEHGKLRVGDGAEVLEVGTFAQRRVYDGGMFFGRVEGHTVVVTPVVYGCLELLCVVVELVVGRVFGVGAFGCEVVSEE